MTRGEALLAWYSDNRRDLPWRHTSDPYRIMVSEVMLQQTQVARVIPSYEGFLERFPSVAALAAAPLDAVLDAWKGLGYPVRARRLREAARIVDQHGWPDTADELIVLPGVGPYTAAAIASFAFGENTAVVDTNVRRVVSRWQGTALQGRALTEAANEELTGDAGTWNQAVMELGALLCRPQPHCAECPVVSWCADPSIYVPPPRQSRFEGSIRQVRGDVLRSLADSPAAIAALSVQLDHSADRIETAVAGLEQDGLVAVVGDQVRIRA